jgi:hypothetical protein
MGGSSRHHACMSQKGDLTMTTIMSKLSPALVAALILGGASAAMAAPRQYQYPAPSDPWASYAQAPTHHHKIIKDDAAERIQDRDYKESLGLPF